MKLVRLNLTDEEYEDLYNQAALNNFGTIQGYLRHLAFEEEKEEVDYEELIYEFEKGVASKKFNEEFKVRDCFDADVWENIPLNNRKVLGRLINRKVLMGGWMPIKAIKKDSSGAQVYEKW
ncbi:DUF1413 domain-containing protein [Priestia megaterium]